MLSVRHEEVVQFDPVLGGEFLPEGELGLLGGFCPHVPEPVCDPMDVGVYADPRFSIPQGKD
jgi:hypothetical protein